MAFSTCTDGKLHCGKSECAVAILCPPTQIYREDLAFCGTTCQDAMYAGFDDCTETTTKGCGCPDGKFLNEVVSIFLSKVE